jgi:prepilin-type N-terminal cleavage/methylation domain-containing protein
LKLQEVVGNVVETHLDRQQRQLAVETPMIKRIKNLMKGRRGFTLIEMVVVIAIMGVLAAVAVPLITSNLGKSKEQSYNTDVALVQSAVDAYYTAPANVRHLGLRQYPIIGFSSSGTLNTWVDGDTSAALTKPLNPLKGAKGGDPKWRDGATGSLRDASEENLNAEAESIAGTGSGWYVVKKTREGIDYATDSRDYFINFTELVTAGLLKEVPDSASTDNTGGSATGTYSFYVDPNGVVKTLLVKYPTNGVADGGSNNGPDNRGFQEAYP